MKPLSDNDSGDNCYLTDISEKDKPWDSHRAIADEIANLYKMADNYKYFERISECSQTLKFCFESINPQEMRLRLKEARFCRVRHCPVCQWRRSLMWRARFFNALPKIQEKYPKAQWIFLTLTIRNCHISDLRDTLKMMNAAWGRLIKRKNFPALGFVKSVEVTRGKDGTAHPHFHCMLMVNSSYFKKGYISQEKWVNMWKDCLKIDYDPIVNIKRIKSQEGNLHKAICETLKYSVKESDLIKDAGWLDALTKQLHKTRAIAIGGCLRDFIRDEDPEDLISEEDTDDNANTDSDVLLVFDWVSLAKRYRKRDH